MLLSKTYGIIFENHGRKGRGEALAKVNTKTMICGAMFLAIGLVLPFFTAQMKEVGNTLLPMHFPVFLCGLICGPCYGFLVGFLLPLLRGAFFSMPPLYPSAVWMAFELATYGFVSGFLYQRKTKSGIGYLYFCIIAAMVSGRIVWGIVKTILLGLGGKSFSFQAFIIGGVLDAIPGIVLQLILIPAIIGMMKRKERVEG